MHTALVGAQEAHRPFGLHMQLTPARTRSAGARGPGMRPGHLLRHWNSAPGLQGALPSWLLRIPITHTPHADANRNGHNDRHIGRQT